MRLLRAESTVWDKEAAKLWCSHFSSTLLEYGYRGSELDQCVLHKGEEGKERSTCVTHVGGGTVLSPDPATLATLH